MVGMRLMSGWRVVSQRLNRASHSSLLPQFLGDAACELTDGFFHVGQLGRSEQVHASCSRSIWSLPTSSQPSALFDRNCRGAERAFSPPLSGLSSAAMRA